MSEESWNGPRHIVGEAGGNDAVARLLRLAGPRPAVPAADAAIVKTAARAHWRRTVKARRRKGIYLWTGGLLAAAIVVAVLSPNLLRLVRTRGDSPVMTLVSATGPVQAVLAETGNLADLAIEDVLTANDVVETGAGGASPASAGFSMAGGISVRIDNGTRLRLISSSVLELETGTVYVDTGADSTGSGLEIRTPLGSAYDVGTQFEVRYEPDGDSPLRVRVRVREGQVIFDRNGRPHTAGKGEQLTVSADGTVVRGTAPTHGHDWDWTLDVLPAFEITRVAPNGGFYARDYLEWANRQLGWEMAIEGKALAQRIGSCGVRARFIVDKSPEDAIDLVLLGCSATSRHEDGVLVIEPVD